MNIPLSPSKPPPPGASCKKLSYEDFYKWPVVAKDGDPTIRSHSHTYDPLKFPAEIHKAIEHGWANRNCPITHMGTFDEAHANEKYINQSTGLSVDTEEIGFFGYESRFFWVGSAYALFFQMLICFLVIMTVNLAIGIMKAARNKKNAKCGTIDSFHFSPKGCKPGDAWQTLSVANYGKEKDHFDAIMAIVMCLLTVILEGLFGHLLKKWGHKLYHGDLSAKKYSIEVHGLPVGQNSDQIKESFQKISEAEPNGSQVQEVTLVYRLKPWVDAKAAYDDSYLAWLRLEKSKNFAKKKKNHEELLSKAKISMETCKELLVAQEDILSKKLERKEHCGKGFVTFDEVKTAQHFESKYKEKSVVGGVACFKKPHLMLDGSRVTVHRPDFPGANILWANMGEHRSSTVGPRVFNRLLTIGIFGAFFLIQYGLKSWYRQKISASPKPHQTQIWWMGFLFNIIVNIQNEILFATAKRYYYFIINIKKDRGHVVP